MNTTGMPANVCSSSLRCGPSPTNASLQPGTCSMMPLMTARFFSAVRTLRGQVCWRALCVCIQHAAPFLSQGCNTVLVVTSHLSTAHMHTRSAHRQARVHKGTCAHTQAHACVDVTAGAPAPNRPTYSSSGASGWPPLMRAFISAQRNLQRARAGRAALAGNACMACQDSRRFHDPGRAWRP